MIHFSAIVLLILFSLIDKLNSQPTLQWAREYNHGTGVEGALAITLDDSGNVYVTGGSDGVTSGRDVATIKYNANGSQQWVRRFNGIENGDDFSRGIVLDKNRNIYTIGCYLIKYNNQSGDTIWVRRLINIGMCGDALDIDSNFNIYTSGRSLRGYYTSKFDTNGNLQWIKEFISPILGGAHFLYDQTIDKWNNVIITGRIRYSNLTTDYAAATVKYAPSGDTLWTRYYNNSDTVRPWDEARACTVDDSGNVYITGYARVGNGIVGDCLIIKYTQNGDTAWTRFYGDGFNGESGDDIDVDKNGNVYVAVRVSDIYHCVVKYNAGGTFQWVRSYPIFTFGALPVLKLDKLGNIYISSQIQRGAWSDLRITKYDSSGNEIWFVTYPGTGTGSYGIYDMVVDDFRNVYATGTTGGDYITVKYSQLTGALQNSHEIPSSFYLYQNYPNPFNPTTLIKFSLPKSQVVTLEVFDVTGREVATLISGRVEGGNNSITFNANNLASGVYFYKLVVSGVNPLVASDFVQTRKMVLLK